MNEKFTKMKSYISSHAPQLVTAAATVGVFAVVLQDRLDRNTDRKRAQYAVATAKDNGWKYEYIPGVGLFVDELNKD